MTARPPKYRDLDLSDDSVPPPENGGLSEWEHGFVDAYLFLHQVEGEPTHEQFNRALHALEHYSHTHQPRGRSSR